MIIAVPALILNYCIAYLKKEGFSPYIIDVLTAVEYGVITVDAGLYLILLFKSAYKAAKDLEL